jgi:hypothetical protein
MQQLVILKTALREIRASANGAAAIRWGLEIGATAEFAQAVLRRYGYRLALGQPPGMVVRQPAPPIALYTAYQRTQVQLAPRLALAWWIHTVSGGPSVEQLLESRVVLAPPARIVPVQQRLEILLDRLTAREIRLESVAATGVAPSSVKAIAPAEPPVPRVVRRAAAAATPSPHPGPDTLPLPGRPAAQSFSACSPAGAPPPVTLSPGEVNHLTDQVLQVLDHRMIAHRERLGRG